MSSERAKIQVVTWEKVRVQTPGRPPRRAGTKEEAIGRSGARGQSEAGGSEGDQNAGQEDERQIGHG